MAPEQLEGKPADARTDLWALGAIVYEMVAGRRAFEGASPVSLIAAIVEREPAPLSSLQPLTPPSLERLVKRCLAKSPDDRWDSAHDVADELRWIAQAGLAPAGTATGPAGQTLALGARRGRTRTGGGRHPRRHRRPAAAGPRVASAVGRPLPPRRRASGGGERRRSRPRVASHSRRLTHRAGLDTRRPVARVRGPPARGPAALRARARRRGGARARRDRRRPGAGRLAGWPVGGLLGRRGHSEGPARGWADRRGRRGCCAPFPPVSPAGKADASSTRRGQGDLVGRARARARGAHEEARRRGPHRLPHVLPGGHALLYTVRHRQWTLGRRGGGRTRLRHGRAQGASQGRGRRPLRRLGSPRVPAAWHALRRRLRPLSPRRPWHRGPGARWRGPGPDRQQHARHQRGRPVQRVLDGTLAYVRGAVVPYPDARLVVCRPPGAREPAGSADTQLRSRPRSLARRSPSGRPDREPHRAGALAL